MKPIILLFITSLVVSAGYSQNTDCSDLKKGTFRYLDIEDTTAYFDLDKEDHIEYHNNGKYNIKSRVKWTSDCRYEMTMISNTIPDFPFKAGDVMVVTINRIENDIIYYTSAVGDMKWDGRLRKVK